MRTACMCLGVQINVLNQKKKKKTQTKRSFGQSERKDLK